MLRYFIFDPSFKWVQVEGFGMQTSCRQSKNTPVVTRICDPYKSRARHHRKLNVAISQ